MVRENKQDYMAGLKFFQMQFVHDYMLGKSVSRP